MPANGGSIDIRGTARAISCIENRGAGADEILRKSYSEARHIPVVGVTGPPGAGKSTLISRLALHWANQGEAVAILAVDPSSPFTGGAVLGDRIRMDAASSHPRVFLRSLSSRGQIGGLSSAAVDVVTLFGYLNFDRVLLETVGAGQADINIGDVADAVVVVSVPGLGDHVQAAKAGILEIGDVYAVNKADLPGAATTAGHLVANLDLVYAAQPSIDRGEALRSSPPLPGNPVLHQRHGSLGEKGGAWRPPVIPTSVGEADGLEKLALSIDQFIGWLRATGRYDQRLADRLSGHVRRTLQAKLLENCLVAAKLRGILLSDVVQEIVSGAITPDDAVRQFAAPSR